MFSVVVEKYISFELLSTYGLITFKTVAMALVIQTNGSYM